MTSRLIRNGKIYLYGPVGYFDYWDQNGFTVADVLNALAETTGDIEVHINSGGGFATEGVAIHNLLVAHKADGAVKVTIVNDSLMASAASVIGMAGDQIIMAAGSLIMIHNGSGMTWGTADDHRMTAKVLDKMDLQMAKIYARRSGKTEAECKKLMGEETWLDDDEAIEAGFATGKIEDPAEDVTAFDFRAYLRAPEPLKAKAEVWAKAGHFDPALMIAQLADARAAGQPKEKSKMTTTPTPAPAAPPAPVDAQAIANAAAEIATLCATAGVPAMAATLIKEGVTIEQAKARIESGKEIRAAVALAHKQCPAIDAKLADQFIASGASMEHVRAQLFTKMTAVGETTPIRGQHQASGGSDRASINSMWDEAAKKVNATANIFAGK
jgi:ATP-dependent protease ClpP protease subunit